MTNERPRSRKQGNSTSTTQVGHEKSAKMRILSKARPINQTFRQGEKCEPRAPCRRCGEHRGMVQTYREEVDAFPSDKGKARDQFWGKERGEITRQPTRKTDGCLGRKGPNEKSFMGMGVL